MATPRIFVSMGTPYTEEYPNFEMILRLSYTTDAVLTLASLARTSIHPAVRWSTYVRLCELVTA